MTELQKEVQKLLNDKIKHSIKSISEGSDVSQPTLTKIKNGEPVSDKTLVYVKDYLLCL